MTTTQNIQPRSVFIPNRLISTPSPNSPISLLKNLLLEISKIDPNSTISWQNLESIIKNPLDNILQTSSAINDLMRRNNNNNLNNSNSNYNNDRKNQLDINLVVQFMMRIVEITSTFDSQNHDHNLQNTTNNNNDDQDPLENPENLAHLSLLTKISRLMSKFIDMKDQPFPCTAFGQSKNDIDELTSFYISNLKKLSSILVEDPITRTVPSEIFQTTAEYQENLAECIGGLSTIVYQNGMILSEKNISKGLLDPKTGVLRAFLHYFPSRQQKSGKDLMNSSYSSEVHGGFAKQSSVQSDSIFEPNLISPVKNLETVAGDDASNILKANDEDDNISEKSNKKILDLCIIPKRAVMVLYCLCEKPKFDRNNIHTSNNGNNNQNNNKPEIIDSNISWLRSACIKRIYESFRIYFLTHGKQKKIKEIDCNKALYLLSISKGLSLCIQSIEDENIETYTIERIVHTIRYQLSLGLHNAPLNDSKMENEVSQDIPETALVITGNRKFKGKLPNRNQNRFRKNGRSNAKNNNNNNNNRGSSTDKYNGYGSTSDSDNFREKSTITSEQSNVKEISEQRKIKLNSETQKLEAIYLARHDNSSSDLELTSDTESLRNLQISQDTTGFLTSPEKGELGIHKNIREKRRAIRILRYTRSYSLEALLLMVNILPYQKMVGFWECFLAEEYNMTNDPGERANLFTTLWLDHYKDNKIIACEVLSEVYQTYQKTFNMLANENVNLYPNKLTTQSIKMGSRLRFTIKALANLFIHENNYRIKIALLNCLNKMVQYTPFNKLQDGLVSFLLENLCKGVYIDLLKIDDSENVNTNATVISDSYQLELLDSVIKLTSSILRISPIHSEISTLHESAKNIWIYQTAVHLIYNYHENQILKRSYLQPMITICNTVPKIIVQLENGTLVEKFFDLAGKNIKNDKLPNSTVGAWIDMLEKVMACINEKCNSDVPFRAVRQKLWNLLLDEKILHMGFNKVATASKAADLVSTIDRDSFELIEHRDQKYLACVILGYIDRYVDADMNELFVDFYGQEKLDALKSSEQIPKRDQEKLKLQQDELIAATIRSAGKLANFPSFQDDFAFLNDLIEAIIKAYPIKENPTSVSFKIRNNTALATANLTQGFYRNMDQLGNEMRNHLEPEKTFTNLIKLSLKACKDRDDKIIPHGLRALGNLTYIFWHLHPERATSPSFQDKMFEEVYKMLYNHLINTDDSKITKSKIRWNAAKAMTTIVNCKNFSDACNQNTTYNNNNQSNTTCNNKKSNHIDLFFEACLVAFMDSKIHKVKIFCAETIFGIVHWDQKKIFLLGRCVLYSFHRDVLNLHKISKDPEKQVGIKRVIIKLFIFFLKLLNFRKDVDLSKLESYGFDEKLPFETVENSQFDLENFVKLEKIVTRMQSSFAPRQHQNYVEDVESLRMIAFNRTWDWTDQIPVVISQFFDCLEQESNIEIPDIAAGTSTSEEYGTRIWFRDLVKAHLPLAVKCKETLFKDVLS